jgi:hypothetical protein
MVSKYFVEALVFWLIYRHEHLYEEIESNVILPGNLSRQGALEKVLKGSQVILCTLDMLSNPKVQDLGLTQAVPVINVIIDEASQIEVSQYIPLFNGFGRTLRKLCFIGDNKQCRYCYVVPLLTGSPGLTSFQVPPHDQDTLRDLESIFERGHLRSSVSFLDTQCEPPISASRQNTPLIDRAFKIVCHPKLVTLYLAMSMMDDSSQIPIIV